MATSIILRMKCRPKKETKHLYHRMQDAGELVDQGVIVESRRDPQYGVDEYVVVDDEQRIWDVIVHDPGCVVAKYPPRKK